ncbi:MAG: 16S rRNA (uracil(1498)-N(3))-methyltransferase, partial [Planctomycetota bacterium]
PEGGFTDEEVALAVAAGAKPVSLGPLVLRIETAAIALAALAVMR